MIRSPAYSSVLYLFYNYIAISILHPHCIPLVSAATTPSYSRPITILTSYSIGLRSSRINILIFMIYAYCYYSISICWMLLTIFMLCTFIFSTLGLWLAIIAISFVFYVCAIIVLYATYNFLGSFSFLFPSLNSNNWILNASNSTWNYGQLLSVVWVRSISMYLWPIRFHLDSLSSYRSCTLLFTGTPGELLGNCQPVAVCPWTSECPALACVFVILYRRAGLFVCFIFRMIVMSLWKPSTSGSCVGTGFAWVSLLIGRRLGCSFGY